MRQMAPPCVIFRSFQGDFNFQVEKLGDDRFRAAILRNGNPRGQRIILSQRDALALAAVIKTTTDWVTNAQPKADQSPPTQDQMISERVLRLIEKWARTYGGLPDPKTIEALLALSAAAGGTYASKAVGGIQLLEDEIPF